MKVRAQSLQDDVVSSTDPEPAATIEIGVDNNKNDYEQLKTEAWAWVGKSMPAGSNSKKIDKVIAYIALLDSLRSGELYVLGIDELKRKWPDGEWNQRFSEQNKEYDVVMVAEDLKRLVSQPHDAIKPKPRKNGKVIAYLELFDAAKSGELYDPNLSADDFNKKWPGGEWRNGFSKDRQNDDVGWIASQIKTEANALEKKFIGNSQKRDQIVAYANLLYAAQSGKLYDPKLSADDFNKKWPGGEWNDGFSAKHKERDVERITEKLRDLLSLPPRSIAKTEIEKRDYEKLKTEAWAWVGKYGRAGGNSEKKDRIIACLEILDATQSGELYGLEIDELKKRWPGGEWSHGFGKQHQDEDIAKILDELAWLIH